MAQNLMFRGKCKSYSVQFYLKRYKYGETKKKVHWTDSSNLSKGSNKALQHFDDFYKNVFRSRWPSIRLALLSPHKYVALVNNFGDVSETTSMLECQGAVNIQALFDIERNNISEKNDAFKPKEKQNLDKLIKTRASKAESEESRVLYGEEADKVIGSKSESRVDSPDNEKAKNVQSPLYSSLQEANYDHGRVIEPELGIDSAGLHEFVPATDLKGLDDYVPESQHYKYYKTDTDLPVEIVTQNNLEFPEHLKVYSFPRGIVSSFPPPRRGALGVFNYYALDGASILPVLALGIQPGDCLLDMCSAPGGKTLTAIQTLYLKVIVCNDLTERRRNKSIRMLNSYLYDFDNWGEKLIFTFGEGEKIEDEGLYDKILVDVPCTNDRLSLHEDDNNIFGPKRLKERLRLPETQSALLANALKLVRPGGTVVYSTCSLSPIQNDGVVHMALRQVWEETSMNFSVVDMSPALRSTTPLFHYARSIGLKYGHLVLPFIPLNFGPMYFCKIVKKNKLS